MINRIVDGKAAVTTEVALKLAATFRTTPEFWLNAKKQSTFTRHEARYASSPSRSSGSAVQGEPCTPGGPLDEHPPICRASSGLLPPLRDAGLAQRRWRSDPCAVHAGPRCRRCSVRRADVVLASMSVSVVFHRETPSPERRALLGFARHSTTRVTHSCRQDVLLGARRFLLTGSAALQCSVKAPRQKKHSPRRQEGVFAARRRPDRVALVSAGRRSLQGKPEGVEIAVVASI